MEYNPFEQAKLANCGHPDAIDSPGAKFLDTVQLCALEARRDDMGSEEAIDNSRECVPLCAHEFWRTFVDLAPYQEHEATVLSDDITMCAQPALEEIAERLTGVLLEELAEDDDDE